MSGYNSDDLQRLEPDYLNSYGLTEAPFAAISQDKFMFIDAERAQRMNMLQHMVRYSNLLLIVQGKTGVGKTSLMRRFIRTAEEDWVICEIAANTMMDAEQLLFQAAQGFGIRQLPQDAGELQEMLYTSIAEFHHEDKIPILIIDDAHELPKDALLAIFNLADTFVDDVNLLRIILFCEPQIEKILRSKDVKSLYERVTHTMDIPAFNEDTTAEYIRHRMAVAGFNGGSPFSPRVIKKIYRNSNGIAEKINTQAHEFLEKGEAAGDADVSVPEEMQRDFEERRQGRPYGYIAAVVIVIALILVFQDEINRFFDGKKTGEQHATKSSDSKSTKTSEKETVVADDIKQPEPAQQTEAKEQITKELDLKEKIISLAEDKPESAQPAQTQTKETQVVEQASEQQTVDAKVEDKQANKQTPEVIATETDKKIEKPVVPAPKITSISPAAVHVGRQQQNIVINGEGFGPKSEVTIGWTGRKKKLSDTQTRLINEKQIEIAITVGMKEDDWSLMVATPGRGESNVFAFKVTNAVVDSGAHKEQWILAQDPSGFTLQLFGTNNVSNADGFIKKHELGERAGYFFTTRNGKDWYSVVYGAYENQADAKSAAKKLPSSLKKIKPWVRRFDDIQADINASRKLKRPAKPRETNLAKPEPGKTNPTAVPQPKTSGLDVNSPANKAWLWSQDPSSFTLQLFGAREEKNIQKFLRKYSALNGKTVSFHTRHDTKDWYAVVYGVYTDRQQAAKAIKRLPKELQQASPWIRSFGSIHAELDRAE